jgi:uroporphyrinogen decarboxylase
MNPKERFLNCISHKKTDRIPIDYLAAPGIDLKLKKYLGLENENELLDFLGSDFYYLPCRDISQNESCLPYYKGPELEFTQTQRKCPFGINWKRQSFDSKFAVDESVSGPLSDAVSQKDILNFNWPEKEWFDFTPMHQYCENNKNRVIVGGFWSGILGDCYRMLGFENFLYNIAANPEMIKTLINRMTDFYLGLNDSIFSELKGKIDIWFFGNDFGSQTGLLFSVYMFKEFFLDPIKSLCDLARSYDIKIMKHSCGAVKPILPLLIEAGVNIIDPVQVTAEGMNIKELKNDFGDRIVFHGAIDTQQLLPNGNREQVKKQCLETIRVMGKNGGYIFAPSQILDDDIPVENVLAMYETAKQKML